MISRTARAIQRNPVSKNPLKIKKKYRRKLIKYTTNYDKVVVVNKEIESIYKKYIGEKVISIPNFIDEVSPKKSKLTDKNIIAVGRLSKEKGFLDLIDIMSLVVNIDSEVTLTLIGDGIEKEKIIPDGLKDLYEYNEILSKILNRETVYLEKQDIGMLEESEDIKQKGINFETREVNFYKSSMELFLEEAKDACQKQKKVVVLAGSEETAKKLLTLLSHSKKKYTAKRLFLQESWQNSCANSRQVLP